MRILVLFMILSQVSRMQSTETPLPIEPDLPPLETSYPQHIVLADVDEPDLKYSNYKFEGGLANKPKPEKISTGGEDALFYSKNLLAVADGVGGWITQGVDSSKYAKRLVSNAKEFFYKNPEHYSEHPKDLLIEAAKKNFELGTSTLILATLWKNTLKIGFIGDSGYILFEPSLRRLPQNRGINIMYMIKEISEEQEHGFNFPFQIGTTGDDPEKSGKEFSHEINYGNLLVLVSDGILDNLFPHEIEHILNVYLESVKQEFGRGIIKIVENFNGADFSNLLALKAFKKSMEADIISPFSIGGMKSGLIALGGKSDDISVVSVMIKFVEGAEPDEYLVTIIVLHFR